MPALITIASYTKTQNMHGVIQMAASYLEIKMPKKINNLVAKHNKTRAQTFRDRKKDDRRGYVKHKIQRSCYEKLSDMGKNPEQYL